MDTDPALTLDFIFFRVSKDGKEDPSRHVKVISSKMMGDRRNENDPTIRGSDHFPIVSEFEIYPLL